MIGAIIGDIVGSRFEFNNHRNTDFEFFHPDCTFTDDTICTIAVADWLISPHIQGLKETMRYWCRKYPSSYGGMFGRWIHDESMGPYNSFGNGSAMRVSPVAFTFHNMKNVLAEAKRSAEITHNHPEGIKGAQAVAMAIWLGRSGGSINHICEVVSAHFGYSFNTTVEEIRKVNTFNETCQVTVPQAFVCLRESTTFEDAIRLAVSIGGDSDTIAAITGSMAEACYGIPEWMIAKAFTYLPSEMITVLEKSYKLHGKV